MAKTLSIVTQLRNITDQWGLGMPAVSVTTTGDHLQHFENTIGTTEESVALSGDLSAPGYALFINRDATNYVQIGKAAGDYCIKLKAGQKALLPMDASWTTIYLKANTAACKVEALIYEA